MIIRAALPAFAHQRIGTLSIAAGFPAARRQRISSMPSRRRVGCHRWCGVGIGPRHTGAASRLSEVRETRRSSAAATTPGPLRLDRRAARVRLFLFLVSCMKARGQRQKDEQTNDLFHMGFSKRRECNKATAQKQGNFAARLAVHFLIDFALTTGRKYHHESFSICGGNYRYPPDPRGEYLCLRSTRALLDKVGGRHRPGPGGAGRSRAPGSGCGSPN